MRHPNAPPGSLWVVDKNPYDPGSTVPLIGKVDYYDDGVPITHLTPGTIVIVLEKIKTQSETWFQVITPTGPGFIHVDWWRKYDAEPPLLKRVD